MLEWHGLGVDDTMELFFPSARIRAADFGLTAFQLVSCMQTFAECLQEGHSAIDITHMHESRACARFHAVHASKSCIWSCRLKQTCKQMGHHMSI